MARVLQCVAVALVLGQPAASAEIIDRIMAVVNGSIITLSDVTGAMKLGYLQTSEGEDALRDTLNQLVERRLMLIEVERYAPAEPAAAKIDALLSGTRARFSTSAEFEAAMAEAGLTLEQLRRHHRDDLRIEAYLQQRFGGALQPSEEDVVTYYRGHEADFTRGGVPRPYGEVREEARAALIVERREALIRDWIAGLRRRADISILPQVGKQPA